MYPINLTAAWIGIVLGFLAGAILGIFFYKEDWMGGYSSWRRRMARLGHISFFGLAIINFMYAVTVELFNINISSPIPSILLICGAVTMPTICFLSAWKDFFRLFFFIPVLCLVVGTITFIVQGGLL